MTEPAPAPVQPDKIGVALAAVGAGASLGGAVVAVGLIVFRLWQASGSLPSNIPLLSGPLFLGIVIGVGTGWRQANAITDIWQRGIVAGLSLFGTAMLAALAAPADALGGKAGLALYGAVLAASGWSALRRVKRARRESR